MLKDDPASSTLISSLSVERALAAPARLTALERTKLLNDEPDEAFERAVRLASRLLNAPVSLVSLVTPERQFFKARRGLREPLASERSTPLSHSFCQYVVATRGPLIVNDAASDPLVRDNRAVVELGVRAYLGVPLREADGEVLGALCAVDSSSRDWTNGDLRALTDIADALGTELALRLRVAALRHTTPLHPSDAERDGTRFPSQHRANGLLSALDAMVDASDRTGASAPETLLRLADHAAALSRALGANGAGSLGTVEIGAVLRAIAAPRGRQVALHGPRAAVPREWVGPIALIATEWLAGLDAGAPPGAASLRWRHARTVRTEGPGGIVLRWSAAPEWARAGDGAGPATLRAAAERIGATLGGAERWDGARARVVLPPGVASGSRSDPLERRVPA